MITLNQLDFMYYERMLKGNYNKGNYVMRQLLATPMQAEDFAKNLGAVSVIFGGKATSNDQNALSLYNLLVSSDVADLAAETWLFAHFSGYQTIEDLINDETAMAAVIASSTAMAAVAASSTAMAAVAASSTAMAAVIASSTARNAIKGSTVAFNAMNNSSRVQTFTYAATSSYTPRYSGKVFILTQQQSWSNQNYALNIQTTMDGGTWGGNTNNSYNSQAKVNEFFSEIKNYCSVGSIGNVDYRVLTC